MTFFRHHTDEHAQDMAAPRDGRRPLSFSGFGEMGAFLLSERERLGISRSEIASSTKITMDQLANLENGTFTGLAPVYARGFLRSYAQTIGIDPSELIAEYRRLSGPHDAADSKMHLASKYDPIDLDSDDGISFGAAMAVLLAAVAAAAALIAFNRTAHNFAADYLPFLTPWQEETPASAAAPESGAGPAVAPDGGAAALEPAAAPLSSAAPQRPAEGSRDSQAAPDPPAGAAGSGAAAPEAASAAAGPALLPAPAAGAPETQAEPPAAAAGPPAPPAPAGGTLRLKAVRPTWAQVSVDNGPVIHVYFKAGEERSFDSKAGITLAAGDGAAVVADWNGSHLGPLGPEGPLELNFPPPRT
ncbi:MAG: helix-turn-helix domain-containing protein [Deltaproteobacteria bacterium]|nr:helix-turn-helix domain-containing protein [Deltaproteobacteria bacterium]